MTDHELVIALKDPLQKKKVFEQLLNDYQKPIYYYVRRMVLDHDDADDVTQNCFIKAWKALEQFRGEAKLSTWLYRIAYNESLSFIEKRKRLAGVSLDELAEHLPSVLQKDALFDGDEIELKLQTALSTLPEKQKAVFIMKYFEEKKYEEIAQITGTSVGALKASFHIAVTKIENYIKVNNEW